MHFDIKFTLIKFVYSILLYYNIYNIRYNNSCFGQIFAPRDPRLNDKKYNAKSSTFTLNRKLIAVTRNYAENQRVTVNNDCPNNVEITNAGGPGDAIHAKNNIVASKRDLKIEPLIKELVLTKNIIVILDI